MHDEYIEPSYNVCMVTMKQRQKYIAAKRPSKEQEHDLIRKAQQGDEDAVESLIFANTGLIMRYINSLRLVGNYDADDAFADGIVGMMHAIRTFNFDFDTRFSTHATHWIRAEIRRRLIYYSNVVNAPANHPQLIKENKSQHITSIDLNAPIKDGGSESENVQEIFADVNATELLDAVENNSTRKYLIKVMQDNLDPVSAFIMIEHYLNGVDQKTIAKMPEVQMCVQAVGCRVRKALISLQECFKTSEFSVLMQELNFSNPITANL